MSKHSDLIIVGEVVSDGINGIITIDEPKEAQSKNERLGIKSPSFPVTNTKIQIKEVIIGRCDGEEIIISQLGMQDNSSETKVKRLRRDHISLMTLYFILMLLAKYMIKKRNFIKSNKLYIILPCANLLIASLNWSC